MKKNNIPRILLLGAGKFGSKHLRVLLKLQRKRLCKVAGVVVKTKKSQKELASRHRIPVVTKLTPKLLQNIDGVIIATPTPTHFSLVKRILAFTNVLVEKPLALNLAQVSVINKLARKNGKVVMVGHIFRFHPLVRKLRSVTKSLGRPSFVSGQFLYPEAKKFKWDVLLELLHPFDIVEYLFGIVPQGGTRTRHKNWIGSSIFYRGLTKGSFDIGFDGTKKVRTLSFNFENCVVRSDFSRNIIEIIKGGKSKVISCPSRPEPLESELLTFLKVLREKCKIYPDIALAQKIITGIKNIKPFQLQRKPKIAVIGGGVFGATVAVELSKLGQVHLFERHDDLMQEASYVNQYRHHMGYHYPRSKETVQESQEANSAFHAVYGDSVVNNFPSYYCISRLKSKSSKSDYLKFCRDNHLPIVCSLDSDTPCDGDIDLHKKPPA